MQQAGREAQKQAGLGGNSGRLVIFQMTKFDVKLSWNMSQKFAEFWDKDGSPNPCPNN